MNNKRIQYATRIQLEGKTVLWLDSNILSISAGEVLKVGDQTFNITNVYTDVEVTSRVILVEKVIDVDRNVTTTV